MKRFVLTSCFIFLAAISFISAAEYDKVLTEMNSIVAANAAYAQLMDIGKNDQGNTIYGLRLENTAVIADAKPNHLVVGAHHGNERLSYNVSIAFAKKIVAIFKNSGDANYAAISKCVYYVVPVLNIGGFNANRRTETNRNGNSIDPNRDYPDVCVQNQYFQLTSISNLATFVERYNIIGAVTIHGYIGTFTYPWGIYTTNTKTMDNTFFNYLGTTAVKANGYRTGTHTDVIYPASGSFEDWAYAKYGVWCMLLELASSPNVDKDAQCLVVYFSLLPADKSQQHQHTGQCTSTRTEGDSRP